MSIVNKKNIPSKTRNVFQKFFKIGFFNTVTVHLLFPRSYPCVVQDISTYS